MAQSPDDLERLLFPGLTVTGDAESGPILDIDYQDHCARISLFGGHVFDWQPAGHAPVLWVSPGTRFNRKRSIRGGTPVCWPWFAVHPTHTGWPSHGYIRTADWTLESAEQTNEAIVLRLSPPVEDRDAAFFPHAMRPTRDLEIGGTLTFRLTQTNTGDEPVEIGQALHTYFAIGDISEMEITGLEATPFIDKLEVEKEGGHREPEGTPITVSSEIDRIYRELSGPVALHDRKLGRTIEISHERATNAVVWNPWIEKTIALGDMGTEHAYRTMMCIETGNVPPDALELVPGQSHTLATQYAVARI